MKTFTSHNFGKIACPETVDEVLKCAIEPERLEPFNVWMWRGQSDIGWKVESAAYRRLKISNKSPAEKNIISYEKRLIKSARYRGYDFSDGRPLSDFDVLAKLQHHGAATRLLDATRSVLVGLYFAAEGRPDRTGVLLGFHCYDLGGYEASAEIRDYDEVVAKLGDHMHFQTWEPSEVSKRIAAQHSQFLYSANQSRTYTGLGFNDKEDGMMALAISPDLKPKVLKVLSETFDIRLPTLFPDLSGFCESNSVRYAENHFSRW